MNMADELRLEDLEGVNGGALGGITISEEMILNFVRENKAAGKALDWCIERAIALVGPAMGILITRETLVALVTRAWNSVPGPEILTGGSTP